MRCYFEAAGNGDPAGREKDAVIRDQSRASRQRAAFALGNAECSWLAMSLRTWHHAPTKAQMMSAEDKLRRAWKARWGEPMDAWIREMQARGVPHFHGFHAAESIFGRTLAESDTEEVFRNGKTRTVFRGPCDTWLIGAWLKASGQLADGDCLRVHRMGIIEKMMSPDAAGRYVAKESAKREQKILPAMYAEGLGRWWWLNPRWEPRPRSHGTLDLRLWPWDVPCAHVWQTDEIQGAFIAAEKVETGLRPGDWLRMMGYEKFPTLEDPELPLG